MNGSLNILCCFSKGVHIPMGIITVTGGNKLSGELNVHGAKNSALPILAATVLIKGETVIHNCPKLSDINAAINILRHLGCIVKRDGHTITVNSKNITESFIPDSLMREMRSSIIFLGALIARTGNAKLSSPGGCELGPRPIDIHIAALKNLGVDITEEGGLLNCKVKNKLKGKIINFPVPSVGATENALIAATVAEGKTVIHNAAREPEISDLANFLRMAGAKITGENIGVIEVEGVKRLNSLEHRVISDRIEAATYMSCAAATGGEIYLKKINPDFLLPVIEVFNKSGCEIVTGVNGLWLKAPKQIKSVETVKTYYYPGFPTDAAPTTLAMLLKSNGATVFVENIFQNRFKYVDELKRFGANISVEGKVAIVFGKEKLYGAKVECTDLRGGAATVVAALSSVGTSFINKIYHIDRGYENLVENLKNLGADISRK